ncbi:hypothetical protein VTH82DRAFT_6497 [Thermothelomyces myriococcoides]
MPASFRLKDEGIGPPDVLGSPPWPSTEELSPPMTQHTYIQSELTEKKKRKKKKKKKRKKTELKEATRTTDDEVDKVEEAVPVHKEHRQRSTSFSPLPSQDGGQAVRDLGSDNEELIKTTSPRSQSRHALIDKKYKGLDQEVSAMDEEREATDVRDRSISDLEGYDEGTPSMQSRGRRPRRDSDTRPRKKRKSSQSSNAGLDDNLEAVPPEERIDGLALKAASADSQLDHDGNIGREEEADVAEAASSSSPVREERISADDALRRPLTPSDHGSQRSSFSSGQAETEIQDTPQREYEGDALEHRGSPELGGDNHAAASDREDQKDDDEMSVTSDLHGSPVATPVPTSPTNAKVGNRELNGEAGKNALSEQESDAAMTPFKTAAKYPSSRSSARRKAKVPFFSHEEKEDGHTGAESAQDGVVSQQESRRQQEAESIAPAEAGPSNAARKPKPKKQKERTKAETAANQPDAQSQPEGSRYRTGALSQTEERQITRAMEQFRENEGLTQQELNQIIHDNPQRSQRPIHGQLWATIQEACPTRPRRKLIEWCRQRYNNWAGRGTWTKEQDDELVDLVAKHGKKWSYIAGLINRYQKDVRDRWRNYLVCRDTVRTDAWSDSEEERFRGVVENAIEKIREGVGKDSKKPPELLINWLDISAAMGHTRSRLQCMEKWKRMCAADPLPDRVPTVLPPSNSRRLQKAREDLRKITAGDKYRLMCAIRDSDAKINWKSITKDTFQDLFERQALLVTWGRLREAVPDWETKTPRDCARYLCEMYENEGHFGSSESAEAAEAEENASVSAKKKRRSDKEEARPTSADDHDTAPSLETSTAEAQPEATEIIPSTINEENDPVPKAGSPKRGKKGKKTAIDASPEKPGDGDADQDVQAGEQAPRGSHTDLNSGKRPRQAEKHHSSELNSAHAEMSPSIEAQAARFRRRDRIANAVDTGSSKGKGREFLLSGAETKGPKSSSKKQRRASLSDVEDIESPKPKKRKTVGSSSKAEGDRIASPGTGKDKAPESNGRSWSVISSDMDDMEDIPATLPVPSQATR